MFNSKEDNLGYSNSSVEDKLLLLFLMDKMEIPISNTQLQEFVLEEKYMNYATLQQTLAEMEEAGYLDITRDNNSTRYTATDEGLTTLEYFEKRIPPQIRGKIVKYVSENRKSIKKDYEITANYFYDHQTNEFIVKCGAYEDEAVRMEVNISVLTHNQAKLICRNWKKNINHLYGSIIAELVSPVSEESEGQEEIALDNKLI